MNQDTVLSFLQFLSNDPKEVFTYCVMDKGSTAPLQGMGTCFGTAFEIVSFEKVTDTGTLHVTLNRTTLKSRKSKDIEAPRVFCVDIDKKISRASLKQTVEDYSPHLIVESSPGKYHIYWKCDEGVPLDQWKLVQLGLAEMFGGDFNLAQVAHTIRVPGVERTLKDGGVFTPEIIYSAPYLPVQTLATLTELIPGVLEAAAKAEETIAAQKKKISKAVRNVSGEAGSGDKAKDWSKVSSTGDRNVTLYSVIRQVVLKSENEMNVEEARMIGEQFNASLAANHPKGALDAAEVKKTVESAYQNALAARERKAAKRALKESALVKRLETQAAHKESLNGHVFQYDYSTTALIHRFTDPAMTERVLQRFGKLLLRVEGGLYAFDNTSVTWQLQDGEKTAQLSSMALAVQNDTIADPLFEIEKGTNQDGERSEFLLKRANERYLGFGLRAGIVQSIKQSTRVRSESSDIFDSNPALFLCANGVVDFGTGCLRPACAEDYLLNDSQVPWDSEAECPGWIQFLHEVFAENDAPEEMVNFMQEVFGYTLSGSMEEEKVFIHYGTNNNGKSKLLKGLTTLAGNYHKVLSADELIVGQGGAGSRGKDAEKFGAKIQGKRVILVPDCNFRGTWNEALIKSATERRLSARGEYERHRNFTNRAKMHVASNKIPSAASEDGGLLRRLCLIEYARRFEENPDKGREIDEMTDREASGRLRWAQEGYARMMARGKILYPSQVTMSVNEYRQENFIIEAACRELFVLPESASSEEFQFLDDLTNDVIKYIEQTAPMRLREMQIENRTVSAAITSVFGIKNFKKKHEKTKLPTRGFRVKLVRERGSEKTDFTDMLNSQM